MNQDKKVRGLCSHTPTSSLTSTAFPPVQSYFEFDYHYFIRKEQSDFGWDWGPAFSPAGPWRPASLVQFSSGNSLHVLNTALDIFREGQISWLPPDQSRPWIVNASIDVIGIIPEGASMYIDIVDYNDGSAIASGPLNNITVHGNAITGNMVIKPDVPKIWWPLNMGNQNLYNVTVSVVDDKENSLATVTKRTGFRTIFLNQRNITDEQLAQGIAPGSNWHFEINGHEFYAKGSNFIPPDAFWPRVTEDRMITLFDAVAASKQNMLRVWASGAYLPDFIYDIADEYGVLLWSEFEFSDALYPVDQPFLDNVAAEVVYNVRRLNHHPSLAVWAGGNEMESLELPEAESDDPTTYPVYQAQYEELFISLIAPLVWENSHSVSYMPSSTQNGYITIDPTLSVPIVERYQNISAHHYYGDSDYYNYDPSVAFDISTYPVNRFANEFGFHSMPSLQTWQQAVDDDDLRLNSTVVLLRTHHNPPGGLGVSTSGGQGGMDQMTSAVQTYYPIPSREDALANFSSWCLATQRFQADMMKSEIAFYRRGSGMAERQLGSLYWQLEDIWQAPTWSGLEYGGRWKVLHYTAKDIYEPVIIHPYWDYNEGDLNITVTSDLWETISGTVEMTWLDLRGKPLRKNANMPTKVDFSLGPINSTNIYTNNINNIPIPDLQDAILMLSVKASGHLPNNKTEAQFTHESYFLPVWPNQANLVDPEIKLSYDEDTMTFTVEATKGVALYTWLDYPAGTVGYFDANSFVLAPGKPKTVQFTVQTDTSSGSWAKNVTVESIWDQN